MQQVKFDDQGRYQEITYLGGGGTSIVYTALDTRLESYVILKVMTDATIARQEGMILQNLEDRRIPYLIDCYEYYQYTILVMQLIEGITLTEYIAKQENCNEHTIYQYLMELADLIAYLHEQKSPILYLDLKPDNIIIGSNGALYLIDFGAARYRYMENRSNHLYGTTQYAPQELIDCEELDETLDERSDIYSFGMIGIYMKTGVSADIAQMHTKYNLSQYFISRRLVKVIRKCVEEDRSKRYQTIREVEAAMKQGMVSKWFGRMGVLWIQGIYALLIGYVAYQSAILVARINLLEVQSYRLEIMQILVLFVGLYVYQKIYIHRTSRRGRVYKQVTHMMLTGRSGVGLWSVVFLVLTFAPLQTYGQEVIDSENVAKQAQLVSIYDAYHRSVLIKENEVYRTNQDIIFEKVENKKTATYQISFDGNCWIDLQSKSFKIDAMQLKAYNEVLTVLIRETNQFNNQSREQIVRVAYFG